MIIKVQHESKRLQYILLAMLDKLILMSLCIYINFLLWFLFVSIIFYENEIQLLTMVYTLY